MFRLGYSRPLVFAGHSPETQRSMRAAWVPNRRRRTNAAAAASGHGGDHKDVVFRRLFDEHWSRVRHHLECFVDNQEEVDELTAEVFVVAWRKLDPSNPMPVTWFLRTADNKIRDRARRTRSKERAWEALVRGVEAPGPGLDPLEALAVRTAIAELNARERQVVVLTYWDDLSAREVAEVLRTSEGAVWTTLTRARTKLREKLEGGGPR
jgi:RNA polymerase sigma factor (sigma-70 family)